MPEREKSAAVIPATSSASPRIGTLNERLAALGLVGMFLLALSALTAPHHSQLAASRPAGGLFELASARMPAPNRR